MYLLEMHTPGRKAVPGICEPTKGNYGSREAVVPGAGLEPALALRRKGF